jgi:hypothetical protein
MLCCLAHSDPFEITLRKKTRVTEQQVQIRETFKSEIFNPHARVGQVALLSIEEEKNLVKSKTEGGFGCNHQNEISPNLNRNRLQKKPQSKTSFVAKSCRIIL